MPLRIAFFVLQSATSDFKQTHCEPRADFCQFYALVSCPYEDMMPYLDAVLNILESHHTIAYFLIRSSCFARGKDVFENLSHALAKRSSKCLE